MSNLPKVREHPPDNLYASDEKKTVAVSGWTEESAIVLGDATMEEWITYDGEVPTVRR